MLQNRDSTPTKWTFLTSFAPNVLHRIKAEAYPRLATSSLIELPKVPNAGTSTHSVAQEKT